MVIIKIQNVLFFTLKEGTMFKGIYLLNFKMCGIKSVDKPIKFDFYKKTLSKNFNPNKYKIKAIYGENGAGRTAVILGVDLLKKLILNGRYLGDTSNQKYLGEVINKKQNEARLECEYIVRTDEVRGVYRYVVEIKRQNEVYEIVHEKLESRRSLYINDSYRTVFETRNGELLKLDGVNDEIYQIITNKTMNVLHMRTFATSSLLATDFDSAYVNSKAFDDVFSIIYLALRTSTYLDKEDLHTRYILNSQLDEMSSEAIDPVIIRKAINYVYRDETAENIDTVRIKMSDFEKYKEKIKRLERYIQMFKKDLKEIIIDKRVVADYFECRLNLDYGTYVIDVEFESTGIKKLIRIFERFNDASDGKIVFIDEIDSNINDVYLGKFVEYFMYYGKGQLCFTLHNPSVMNVLRYNKKSIDFLATNNKVISWTTSGNASPEKAYKNGMIENLPFNIEPSDFLGILGE